jgi:class 3 adenylate cyclase
MKKPDISKETPIAIAAPGGFRVSLKVKFSFFTILILGGMMAAVTWFAYVQTSAALGREVRERGATIARNLATNATESFLSASIDELNLAVLVKNSVQENATETITALDWKHQLLSDLLGNEKAGFITNQGVVEAVVVEANSNSIKAHSAGSHLVSTIYQSPVYIEPAMQDNPYPTYLWNGERVFDISIPIVEKVTDKTMGVVHLGLRRSLVEQAVRSMAIRVIAITFAALLIALLATFLLVRVLVKPVDHLVRGVRAIANGDFAKRIVVRSRDELGELSRAYNEMAKSLGENEALKSAFSKYTSASLMQDILKDPTKMNQLGGKRVPATMFFSMVHGVSELSATLDAEEFVGIINDYLSVQTRVITKHHGQIDKFVREEVMAVWGVPEPKEGDTLNAVAAAVECQKELEKLNLKRQKAGKPFFGVSIGVNNGEVVAGNMGSHQKMDYTVIGDAVNTAARLMANGKGGQVLISEGVYEVVASAIEAQVLDPVRVKGKKEPLKVWHVMNVRAKK